MPSFTHKHHVSSTTTIWMLTAQNSTSYNVAGSNVSSGKELETIQYASVLKSFETRVGITARDTAVTLE